MRLIISYYVGNFMIYKNNDLISIKMLYSLQNIRKGLDLLRKQNVNETWQRQPSDSKIKSYVVKVYLKHNFFIF